MEPVRYQEILRRLAIIDEEFARAQAGLEFTRPARGALDPVVTELVRIGALVASGSPEVCLEWSTSRALAAGATEEEVTGVLLAVAPVIGLGRMTGAAPGVAGAFGYDIDTALEDPGSH
jgi:alkylhydroperoxidase/carboxymuconolactone decarboxylase family protein YurZ